MIVGHVGGLPVEEGVSALAVGAPAALLWARAVAATIRSGGGGIRTRGPRERTPVFKTGAFDRSATPPGRGQS